jgi:hypothetical protein
VTRLDVRTRKRAPIAARLAIAHGGRASSRPNDGALGGGRGHCTYGSRVAGVCSCTRAPTRASGAGARRVAILLLCRDPPGVPYRPSRQASDRAAPIARGLARTKRSASARVGCARVDRGDSKAPFRCVCVSPPGKMQLSRRMGSLRLLRARWQEGPQDVRDRGCGEGLAGRCAHGSSPGDPPRGAADYCPVRRRSTSDRHAKRCDPHALGRCLQAECCPLLPGSAREPARARVRSGQAQ